MKFQNNLVLMSQWLVDYFVTLAWVFSEQLVIVFVAQLFANREAADCPLVDNSTSILITWLKGISLDSKNLISQPLYINTYLGKSLISAMSVRLYKAPVTNLVKTPQMKIKVIIKKKKKNPSWVKTLWYCVCEMLIRQMEIRKIHKIGGLFSNIWSNLITGLLWWWWNSFTDPLGEKKYSVHSFFMIS